MRKLWYAEYAMTTSTVHSKAVIYLSLLVKPQQLISSRLFCNVTDFSVTDFYVTDFPWPTSRLPSFPSCMLYEDLVVLGIVVLGAWCSYQMMAGFEQRRSSVTRDERLSELANLVRSQQAQLTELKLVIQHQRITIHMLQAQNSTPTARRMSSPTCITAPLSAPWN